MPEDNKQEINLRPDQLTIDDKGQVIINDREVLDRLKDMQASGEEGGFTLNFIC